MQKKEKKKGKDNNILKIEEISNTCQSHSVSNPTSCHSFSLCFVSASGEKICQCKHDKQHLSPEKLRWLLAIVVLRLLYINI